MNNWIAYSCILEFNVNWLSLELDQSFIEVLTIKYQPLTIERCLIVNDSRLKRNIFQ